jgi:hypothetical protein
MKKEFVPYELALRMKQLGFDEPCLALYLDNDKKTMTSSREGADTNSWLKEHYKAYGDSVTAPTWQSAFRWFREKYELVVDWNHSEHDNFGSYIGVCIKNVHLEETIVGVYKEHEEAELACITALINIVENKQQAKTK